MPCSDGLALDRMDRERIIQKRRNLGMMDSIPNLPWEVVIKTKETIAAFESEDLATMFVQFCDLEAQVIKCPC